MLTLSERATLSTNKTAKLLFQLMHEKKSNLSVAVDVTRSAELIALADILGPYICLLKTHIDIINDFTPHTITALKKLATQHRFLIFEDRKFAEIGNTAMMQYEQGIYHIADWAHITNAHPLPGAGLIQGLKKIGYPKGNGLLLIAEMSAAANLITPAYTQQAIELAHEHKEFVIGFISMKKLVDDPCFIHLTPGIQLKPGKDALGQQYVTPTDAIIKNGTDIIIVGRGIYQASDPQAAAEQYQQAGWHAYLNSVQK